MGVYEAQVLQPGACADVKPSLATFNDMHGKSRVAHNKLVRNTELETNVKL